MNPRIAKVRLTEIRAIEFDFRNFGISQPGSTQVCLLKICVN